MSLTSLSYVFFLAVCTILYYLLPKKCNNICLLLFSIVFYAYAMPGQLIIMMIYIWVIFLLGLLMKKNENSANPLMIVGVVLSVVFLLSYKLTKTYIATSIIVPIGISYITFQCIAYLVEIRNRKFEAVTDPVDFFLYILFFTKVTAGPIEPPANFFAEINQPKKISSSKMYNGVLLIIIGFVKKMVIADVLAVGVNAVYASPDSFDGLSVLLSTIMYSFQIYFDFAGYTDIARGSSLLFGINLMENFKRPYLASSVVDFWRRWHISLTSWLRQYIYFPLGGSRVGTVRRYLNVMIVFVVSGFWHGSTLNFIVWGMLHGIFQVIEIMLRPVREMIAGSLNISENNVVAKVLGCIKTFILVTFAWIFFRATDMSNAFDIIGGLFQSYEGFSVALSSCMLSAAKLMYMVLGIAFIELAGYLGIRSRNTFVRTVCLGIPMIWLVIVASVTAYTTGGASSFIYFNF